MRQIEGIIFDMDGLLFDTETIYYETTQKIADCMNLPYNRTLYLSLLGQSDEEIHAAYYKRYQKFGTNRVAKFINEVYKATYEIFEQGKIPLKKGALSLLDYLEKESIPKVIASSNTRPVIDLLLEKAELTNRFSGIVSAENVTRAKPDPELFIQAMHVLETQPTNTLILEDSLHGVDAAYDAGIPVIMIPDLMPPTEKAEEKAMKIFSSLEQVITDLNNKI